MKLPKKNTRGKTFRRLTWDLAYKPERAYVNKDDMPMFIDKSKRHASLSEINKQGDDWYECDEEGNALLEEPEHGVGWYVKSKQGAMFIRKDGTLQNGTGMETENSAYFDSKEEAIEMAKQFNSKQKEAIMPKKEQRQLIFPEFPEMLKELLAEAKSEKTESRTSGTTKFMGIVRDECGDFVREVGFDHRNAAVSLLKETRHLGCTITVYKKKYTLTTDVPVVRVED